MTGILNRLSCSVICILYTHIPKCDREPRVEDPRSKAVFLRLFRGRTPKIIVQIPINWCLWKRGGIMERLLLQYFQSPDKNSRDISRYIYKMLRYFKIVMYLFHYFCRNPQRYSVDPYLRNTAINDWSHNVVRVFLDIYVFADTCIYIYMYMTFALVLMGVPTPEVCPSILDTSCISGRVCCTQGVCNIRQVKEYQQRRIKRMIVYN